MEALVSAVEKVCGVGSGALLRKHYQESNATPKSRVCPSCCGTRIVRHGIFPRKDGGPAQRFRCKNCGKTFSENTGTPAAYLKHQTKWRKMVSQMHETQSLRITVLSVGIHLSTAFRWRHRWLAAQCQKGSEALTGQVSVTLTTVPYSEKGSRICRGPGSWGYWNKYLRGDRPERLTRPGFVQRPFRPLIDGRATTVLLVQNGLKHVSRVLGPRPGVDAIENGMKELVSHDATVHDCELTIKGSISLIAKACERLNLQCLSKTYGNSDAGDSGTKRPPAPAPEHPNGWLSQFRRVATKYLHHYMAWFDYQVGFKMLINHIVKGAAS